MATVSRRAFLNRSALTVAGFTAAASQARRAAAVEAGPVAANDKLRLALIGCGGMGRGDLETFLENPEVDCPLICDVDDAQLDKAAQAIERLRKGRPERVKDFRRVMDSRNIDLCLVATPDHWHALPTIHACQAGKDVYVEKPLATSIAEGRAMLHAARKADRVVQMGTQWRSGSHYGDAVDFVQSGKLGKIRLVRMWAALTWIEGIGKPADGVPPSGVDYDMWLGPAEERPFNPARFHFTFRWFWDYAGGLMTDWGVHLINIAHWAMRAGMPRSVCSTGGKFVLDDMSQTPDTQVALFEYPDFTMIWEHQAVGNHGIRRREHGVEFLGTAGALVVDANGWEVMPVPGKGLEPFQAPGTTDAARSRHVRNFLDCVGSRRRPVTDVEIGHQVSTIAHLGNVALRSGRKIVWDAEKEQASGDSAANEFVAKAYRKPWTLPT